MADFIAGLGAGCAGASGNCEYPTRLPTPSLSWAKQKHNFQKLIFPKSMSAPHFGILTQFSNLSQKFSHKPHLNIIGVPSKFVTRENLTEYLHVSN